MKNSRISAISAENDRWLRLATATAIAKVKELIGPRGPIRSDTPAGRLPAIRRGVHHRASPAEKAGGRLRALASRAVTPRTPAASAGLRSGPRDIAAPRPSASSANARGNPVLGRARDDVGSRAPNKGGIG